MATEAASGLWRSEDMTMLQLHMQREVAHDTVLKLGQIGAFQFVDLNKSTSAFQRDFAQEVRRCDDMERKVRYLVDEVSKAGLGGTTVVGTEMETLNSLDRKIDEREKELCELSTQFDALANEKNRVREHFEVLTRELGVAGDNSGGLLLVCGVAPKEKVPTIERL